MNGDAATTVLLVEDHVSYAQALSALLALEGDLRVVATVATVAEAGAAAGRTRPDVALVDLDLAGEDGVAALADVRERSPSTACVVLTALRDDVAVARGIEAGAVAALHKSVDAAELLEAVRQVARGRILLPDAETRSRLQALAARREADWASRALGDRLTDRELEILEHLTEGRGNAEIATRLGISPETVQTHVRNLLAKLRVSSRLEAVVLALRHGIVRPPEGQR